MDVIKYLQKAGYDTVQSSFYEKIREWESWYVADVRWAGEDGIRGLR